MINNRFPYAVEIGFRYTRASKKSGMLSFLSSISMFGLVLGIALLIVVLSVMNGFERELRERILALLPQASLYQAGGIDDWKALRLQIMSEPEVTGAAPFIRVSSLLSYRGNTEPAMLYAVDYETERQVSLIDRFVEASSLKAFSESDSGLLVGSGLKDKLGLDVGSELMIVAPGTSGRRAARIAYMPVLGFITSNSEIDESLVLANIRGVDALRPSRTKGSVDGLRLQFKNLDDAPYLAMNIANALGPTFYQSNWQRTHGNLYHAIRVSKNMVALLMSLVIALAAFNIVSTLILVVTEKQSSIAILRTLGASPRDILVVFVTQGLVIGSGGVIIGVLFGCGLTAVLEPAVQFIQKALDYQFLYSDTYPLADIPAQIVLSDVISVAVTAMCLVFVATIFPAVTAMRMQPADVLRYE